MAKQNINVGTAANDKKGDSLRAAFQKVNANFTELYTELGLVVDANLNLGAFEFAGSTLSTTDSSAIVIDQSVTVSSNLTVGGDVLPSVTNGGDLGSAARPWRSLYVSNNTIFLGGTALSVNGAGNLLVNGSLITGGGVSSYADLSGKPTLSAVATTGAYADLTGKPTLFSGSYADLTGKPTLFSGSYADLTNKPNIAGTYQFSVAADDSTQRVISTDEVVKFVGAGGITTASDAEGRITITQGTTSSLVNGARTASLGSDGALTIPGDIKSNGNINIEINLSDSTLRRWSFGEDGDLTLPRGYIKNDTTDGFVRIEGPLFADMVSLGGGSYATIANGVQILTHAVGDDTERKFNFSWDGSLYMPIASNNNQVGAIEWRNVGTAIAQIKTVQGNATSPDGLYLLTYGTNTGTTIGAGFNKKWIFRDDGSLTLPGDIKSDGNINIEVNLSDSTKRIWQFGEDGDLTLAGNIESADVLDITAQSQIRLVSRDDNVQIRTNATSEDTYIWQFGSTGTLTLPGSLTLPGDIRSNGNINIDINLSDSTLRRWQFGEDGKLTFPDGANYAGQTVTMPTTIGNTTNSFVWEFSDLALGTDRITLNWNLLASDTAGFYIGTTHSTTGKYLFLDGTDQSLSYIAGDGVPGGGKLIFGSSAGNNAGDANAIEIKASNGDVYLTSTESVKITVDAADSSARIWKFDPAGELTFPDATTQTTAFTGNATALVNGSYSISAAYNGIDIRAPLTWKENNTDRVVLTYNSMENGFVIATNVTGVTQGWFFYNDGSLTLPGSIVGTATQAVFNTISTTVNAFGAATTALNIGASGAPITGFAATATTSSTASSLGYLGLPQSATATTATLAIGDAGKHIYVTTASQTITIPANASVAYPIGTTLTFIAGPSATTVLIAITSDTLRLAGSASTGQRTLAANGMATAVKVAATTWYINGTGLT